MNGDAAGRFAILIPVYNHAEGIGPVVERAGASGLPVWVVDDGSTDGTAAILKEAAGIRVIRHRENRGKGAALLTGFAVLAGTADWAVTLDADGQHDPADIPALVAPILAGRADHVSGSRLIGGSSELHGGFDECFRLMGSSLITACVNHRFGVQLSESQNGFRAIRTEVLRDLGLVEDITTIEQEMIIKTLKKGYRMGEVPSHEHKRKGGVSKISLRKVAVRYVWTMVKYLYLTK